MTKECRITVKNDQTIFDGNVKDHIETSASGSYYEKGRYSYAVYEETSEDGKENVKSILKFNEEFLELKKNGHISTHMHFKEGVSYNFFYRTPYGDFFMTVTTREYILKKKEKSISLHVKYDMEMDQKPYAGCEIDITIESI